MIKIFQFYILAPSKSPSAEKKKSKKSKKKNGTPVVALHAAPKPEYPQGQVSTPIQYIDPNDIDTSFGQFAKQMQHPAYLNSETMLREMIEKGKSKIFNFFFNSIYFLFILKILK